MNILFAITGIAFALFVAFLFSFDRKKIDFKKTLIMIFIQVLIVLFMNEHNDWFDNFNCTRFIF